MKTLGRGSFRNGSNACFGVLILVAVLASGAAASVRVATFNVENYLEMDRRVEGHFRPSYPKPEREKAGLRAVIRDVQPDVIALQEIGSPAYLEELRRDLRQEGFDYPFGEVLEAADPVRHVALLSRLPLARVTPHRDIEFKYLGSVETVKRGLLEVSFAAPDGEWSLFVIHLKSRLTERPDDPEATERRLLEARAIRDRILERGPDPDRARFIIAGDCNDTARSKPLRAMQRRGQRVITSAVPATDSRGETWTHRFAAEGLYSRVDFLLVSPALWPHVVGGRGVAHDGEGALHGSDHRLVYLDLDWEKVSPAVPLPEEIPDADDEVENR